MGKRIVPFPRSRRIIVDVGRVTSRRPTIYGLLEADVSSVLPRIEDAEHSVTSYVVVTFARAVAACPNVQALRDWRGRLVVFDDVDVAVSVEIELEGRSFPLTHIVRAAQTKNVAAVTAELRSVQREPNRSPSLQHARWARMYVALPAPLRRLALRALYRLPDQQRLIMGTVGVSSVGMFGDGGGYGIGLPIHPVDLLVGGITTHDGGHRRVALTVGFDHDVVDGAPATRFTSGLRAMIENGDVLDD